MGYRRVTSEDRLRIKDGLDAGLTNAEIADKLTAVRVESYGDTLGAPAGLERGAFPVKTGGERYKTPGQYRSDLKGQTADGVLVIGRGI
jgi:hypothetical protein